MDRCDICGNKNIFLHYFVRNWEPAKCLFCNDTYMSFNVCQECCFSEDRDKNWSKFMDTPCVNCLREIKLNEVLK